MWKALYVIDVVGVEASCERDVQMCWFFHRTVSGYAAIWGGAFTGQEFFVPWSIGCIVRRCCLGEMSDSCELRIPV